jgi:VanZ family protein
MRIISVAAGWAWAAAIVWLSLTSAPPELDVVHGDKLGHLVAYGVLMFWFCQLYAARKVRIAYALGFAALGVVLELIQGQLGYRDYELLDMVANAAGLLLGWAAAALLGKPLLV